MAHGVNDDTVLTISGLQASSSYEIRAYLLTRQAFDLYRSSNTGPAGTLIAGGSPGLQVDFQPGWIGPGQEPVHTSSDPCRHQSVQLRTPTTRRDDQDLDTPTPTDNDGVDTPYTDYDGVNTPQTSNDGSIPPLHRQ